MTEIQPTGRTNRFRTLAVGLVVIIVLAATIWTIYHYDQHRKNQSLLEKQQAAFAKTATADPILKYLPYGAPDYTINPTFKTISGSRTLVLSISIILDGSDYKKDKPALDSIVSQKKQEALSYIHSIGFDPAKYTIQYQVPAY